MDLVRWLVSCCMYSKVKLSCFQFLCLYSMIKYTYLLTKLLTYLLSYLLHGAESFLIG